MKPFKTEDLTQAYDSFHYTLTDFRGQTSEEQTRNYDRTLERLETKASKAATIYANCNAHAKKNYHFDLVAEIPSHLERFKSIQNPVLGAEFEKFGNKFQAAHSAFIDALQDGVTDLTILRKNLSLIRETAQKSYKKWGFKSSIEACEKSFPKSTILSLHAQCEAILKVKGFSFKVSFNPLGMAEHAHFSFRSVDDKNLPFSNSRYLSRFVSLSAFCGGHSVSDYIKFMMEDVEEFTAEPQLSLF